MIGSSAVVVTPIYWVPTGFSIPDTYKNLTTGFINDVAAASGSSTNVFSILTQYQTSGSLETSYDMIAGAALTDSTTYPTAGSCASDPGSIYPDGSGYSACVTNLQLQNELTRLHVAEDSHHLYLFFLPEGVETCATAVDGQFGGACSLNTYTSGFCGYHSYVGTGVFAVMPYANTGNSTGYECTSQLAQYADGSLVGNQSPNNDLASDTAISVMSHEMSEAITDPYLNAWYDLTPSGISEIGDECAYIYGDSLSLQGTPGAQYNQTINGHHYFIQEEFSNQAYSVDPNYGCAQNDQASVVFDPNGGSGSMPPQFAVSATALESVASTLTNPGMYFAGWNTSPDGSGTAYANGATYSFSDSTTLYAQWASTPTYEVTFDPNGGTGTMNAEFDHTATALTANSFTRTGYTFVGWNTVASGVGGTSYGDGTNYPFTSAATLYAQWSHNSYTVTFAANGGTGSMSPETDNAVTGLTTNTFTRTGYSFVGWNTVASGVGGTSYGDGTSYPFTAAATLYAQWALIVPAPPRAPSAPVDVAARLLGRSLNLTWSVPTSGSAPALYSVYEGTSSGKEASIPVNAGFTVTGLSLTLGAPSAGQTRYFVVTATNAGGTSPRSNEVVVAAPRLSTTTALRVSPSTVSRSSDRPVVFTVTVKASRGATAARGTVHISSGSKVLCTMVLSARSTGSCHISVTGQHPGLHSVVAQFLGDSSANGSRSTKRAFKVT